ncbi:Csu type fimbrial protein, partial [Klebsiella pneumoniae]|uniref:Csu type fimbrial protein n=1 Tax=Klebsiella pneumoniae TaxID=573 RepID=UPI0023DD8D46
GRERVGLTNDELQKCHYHVAIPANPDYSSLNLLSLILISSNVNFPLYIKTTAGANVRSGTYTDTINLIWNY